MEAIMATASSPHVKSPRTSTPASSCVPDAEAIDLVVLALDDLGMIRDCGRACEQMFGYPPHELAGRHVSLLLPQLPDIGLVQEGRINSRLAHLCHCAVSFQARRRDGRHFASELFINRLGSHNVVVLVRSLEASILNGDAFPSLPAR
ncbi:MAG: PAS domain-containing protein [Thiobacillus sp.]|nr:PAS domain-containing protein [Thiobacillus sp.]